MIRALLILPALLAGCTPLGPLNVEMKSCRTIEDNIVVLGERQQEMIRRLESIEDQLRNRDRNRELTREESAYDDCAVPTSGGSSSVPGVCRLWPVPHR